MEQVALRLPGPAEWLHVAGEPAGGAPRDVVLRAMDRAVEFATGACADAPDGRPVTVPVGEGRRLSCVHLFARPAVAGAPCRITVRGV